MEPQATFVQACLADQADPSQVDDWVERWHSQPTQAELHEYLGLSLAEYGQWVKSPDCLAGLITAKRSQA